MVEHPHNEKRESQQTASQGYQGQHHGVNLLGTEIEVVAVVEAQTLVFPGHEEINLTNDNYFSTPTQFKLSVEQVGSVKQKRKQTLRDLICKKAVSYQDVICHVHSVTLHGQPQRKGLGPDLSLNKIKVVKGVSCVSPCLSAPSVPNVPHVATEICVGGRLQSFWQVWQRLGSNSRVISILRDGYNLLFRERPQLSPFPLIVSKYAIPLKSKALLEALASLLKNKQSKR